MRRTNRAVYIGGFGGGQHSADKVAHALKAQGYKNPEPFTFSYAMDNPHEVAVAVEDADLWEHSAATLASKGTFPRERTSVGAPLPVGMRKLMTGTGEDLGKLTSHAFSGAEEFKAVGRFGIGYGAELLSHPLQLRQLREIGRFDALEHAAQAQKAGIKTWLFYNERDSYFRPTMQQQAFARFLDIELHDIPGQHNELLLHPAETLAAINAIKRAA